MGTYQFCPRQSLKGYWLIHKFEFFSIVVEKSFLKEKTDQNSRVKYFKWGGGTCRDYLEKL